MMGICLALLVVKESNERRATINEVRGVIGPDYLSFYHH